MEAVLQRPSVERVFKFFSQKIVYHTFFWALLFVLLVAYDLTNNRSFFFSAGKELVNVGFYAIIVYFNLYYLIPNYLTRNKFFTYAVLLVLSSMVITPIKAIVLFFQYANQPSLQSNIISDLNWYFVVSFFFAGSSTITKIIGDWVRHTREKQELETQTMQSELNFLKSQINPHFLFNTLNNLYALTLKKSDKAPEIVIKLSEMMRYMLYECNEKRVLLSKEVNYIKNYLELEMLRKSAGMQLDFQVEGHITDQKIVPLMFVPFIENSFKHGLNSHIDKGYVHILLRVDKQYVDFSIENSKPDAKPGPETRLSRERSGGIGLVNVRRRLELLYPGRHELAIEETPNTYKVNMLLELDQLT